MGTLSDSRLKLRVDVLCHQDDLDRELAAGTAPDASPRHELRASQLQSSHKRRELAHAIDSVLHRAEHEPHWHSPALPVRAEAIQAARQELEELRSLLQSSKELSSRGLAMASLLVHDPHSPVYSPASEAGLGAEVRAALAVMHIA